MGPIHKYCLGTAVDWLMRKICRYGGRSVRSSDSIKWLIEQDYGVYVLRLLGKGIYHGRSNDHFVCIDVCAKQFLDCVERYALFFSHDSL